MLLCFSEAPWDYNTSHQGLYIDICGVNPKIWGTYLDELGIPRNSIQAGFAIYKFYLEKNKGNKVMALREFKGVINNTKVKGIINKMIKIEKIL